MAASTASRGPPMPITICRPGWISKPSCSPSRMPPNCCARRWRSPATHRSPIAMGTNTDPYQPIEGRYRITRADPGAVPRGARTRSPSPPSPTGVLHDLDLLEEMARHRLVAVGISVTSAGCAAVADAGTARAFARKAAGGAGAAGRGWRADAWHDRARHPRDHRRVHRSARWPGWPRRGVNQRGLDHDAPAARGCAPVPRMAGRALPRPRIQGDGAGAG